MSEMEEYSFDKDFEKNLRSMREMASKIHKDRFPPKKGMAKMIEKMGLNRWNVISED